MSDETKQPWMSKTVWASIVAMAVAIAGLLGVGSLEGEQESLTELVMQVVTLASGLVALIGRLTAKKKIGGGAGNLVLLLPIGVLLLIGLMLGGCRTVSPEQAMTTRQAAVLVSELDRRCQAGDDAACRDGLAAAAEALDAAADAMSGQ